MSEPGNFSAGGTNGTNPDLAGNPNQGGDSSGTTKPARYKWGTQDKTLWDWMDLLLVPGLLLVITLMFNELAQKRQDEFTLERKKQEVVQNYLSKMTDLISNGKLLYSKKSEFNQTSIAARALTQSALVDLKGDASRKGQVLSFLYEAQLISYQPSVTKTKPNTKPKSIIDMKGINLSGAALNRIYLGPQSQLRDSSQPDQWPINLGGAILSESDLRKSILNHAYLESAQLQKAQLQEAMLNNVNLKRANLAGAKLAGANLEGADLSYADLTGADLQRANLSGKPNVHDAKLNSAKLRGANLRDANLSNAHLDYADLTEADLTGANLYGANLNTEIEYTKFCQTTMPEGTVNSSGCSGLVK